MKATLLVLGWFVPAILTTWVVTVPTTLVLVWFLCMALATSAWQPGRP